MKFLDMSMVKDVEAYEIDGKLFNSLEVCEEYIRRRNLKYLIERCFEGVGFSDVLASNAAGTLADELIKNGESIKKWL